MLSVVVADANSLQHMPSVVAEGGVHHAIAEDARLKTQAARAC